MITMTHDELLAKINSFTCCSGAHQIALRAVVELHKPSRKDYSREIGCMGCGVNAEYGTWEQDYPCETIQAIVKELT